MQIDFHKYNKFDLKSCHNLFFVNSQYKNECNKHVSNTQGRHAPRKYYGYHGLFDSSRISHLMKDLTSTQIHPQTIKY